MRDGLKPAPTEKSNSKIQKERGHGPSKLRVNESCPYKGSSEIGESDSRRQARTRQLVRLALLRSAIDENGDLEHEA
jgi:hypothetical protein